MGWPLSYWTTCPRDWRDWRRPRAAGFLGSSRRAFWTSVTAAARSFFLRSMRARTMYAGAFGERRMEVLASARGVLRASALLPDAGEAGVGGVRSWGWRRWRTGTALQPPGGGPGRCSPGRAGRTRLPAGPGGGGRASWRGPDPAGRRPGGIRPRSRCGGCGWWARSRWRGRFFRRR